jgi:hypothetical protein
MGDTSPIIWYIQTIGGCAENLLVDMRPQDECLEVKCVDGRPRRLWSVTLEEVLSLNARRSTDHELRFRVWHKDTENDLAKLWEGDLPRADLEACRGFPCPFTDGHGNPPRLPPRLRPLQRPRDKSQT